MFKHLDPVRYGFACVVFCLAAQGAAGQQFQQQTGLLPVPTDYWTEAVTVVDADEDGRSDVLFVHANGWAVPGDFGAVTDDPLPMILLLNTGTSGGNPVFVDASSTYLPANLTMHGKGASVADYSFSCWPDSETVITSWSPSSASDARKEGSSVASAASFVSARGLERGTTPAGEHSRSSTRPWRY